MTQSDLNSHIAYIQYLHAQLAEDYCNALQFNSRGLSALETNNFLVSEYLDSLYRQDLNDTSDNTLSESQISDIIDDCYRRMRKYR